MGIRLDEGDSVIGMATFKEGNPTLLVVTENGFGKRTELEEYKVQTRGGKGILTYKVTEKTGKIAGVRLVDEADDLMLISSDGTIIRMKVNDISILGRATQGVTLMRTSEGNIVVGVARIINEDDEEQDTANDEDSESVDDSGENNE
jgi:DNA gyrase subunit A